MKPDKLKPNQRDAIEDIFKLILQGVEAWVEAGKRVAAELEQDPDFADNFHEIHPQISVDYIYAFDRIGRIELHPMLAISDCPGAIRLRRLPYAAQEKYVNEPIAILIREGKGWTTLRTSVFNLTPEQARQVFAEDHIRTEAEQRAWIEDKSAKAIVQFDEPFRVSGRKLIVMQPCQLTAKQLATVLAQME